MSRTWEGPRFYSNNSAKFEDFAERCWEGSNANNNREVYIGYTSYGAEYNPKSTESWYHWRDLGDATDAATRGRATNKDIELIKEARNTLYPNSYTVRDATRYGGYGEGVFDYTDLLLEWNSATKMPED